MAGGLELRGRDVAAGLMEASGVPPVDPAGGARLDLVGREPGALAVDELGLAQPVDRLGVRVVRTSRPRLPTEPTASASASRSL